MARDDFVDSDVAIAVAATAAVLSPKVRGALRQGAVYGLAGVLAAGDALGAFVSGVGRGVHQGAAATTGAATAAGTDATTATTLEEAADALEARAAGAEAPVTDDTAPPPGRRARRTRTDNAGDAGG